MHFEHQNFLQFLYIFVLIRCVFILCLIVFVLHLKFFIHVFLFIIASYFPQFFKLLISSFQTIWLHHQFSFFILLITSSYLFLAAFLILLILCLILLILCIFVKLLGNYYSDQLQVSSIHFICFSTLDFLTLNVLALLLFLPRSALPLNIFIVLT